MQTALSMADQRNEEGKLEECGQRWRCRQQTADNSSVGIITNVSFLSDRYCWHDRSVEMRMIYSRIRNLHMKIEILRFWPLWDDSFASTSQHHSLHPRRSISIFSMPNVFITSVHKLKYFTGIQLLKDIKQHKIIFKLICRLNIAVCVWCVRIPVLDSCTFNSAKRYKILCDTQPSLCVCECRGRLKFILASIVKTYSYSEYACFMVCLAMPARTM